MSILFFSLLVSLFTYTSSVTVITTNPWVDDFVYDGTDYEVDAWYDGSWGSAGGDLSGTASWQGIELHGWYDKTSTEDEDAITREFKCPYYSDVVISFAVYFCVDSGSNPFIYYDRYRVQEYESYHIEYQSTYVTELSSWSTLSQGPCGRDVKKATLIDSFKLKSNDKFAIYVKKEFLGNSG
eukprot:1121257_1